VIPVTFKLEPIPTSLVTVKLFSIVTLVVRPMTTLFVPVAVSISFAVPSISKTSVFRLILSFDPESADTARFDPLGELVSTYALIDC